MTTIEPVTVDAGQVAIAVRNVSLEAWEGVNTCIETTRLSVLVYQALGLNAMAQAVKVTVMNRAAYALYQQRVPLAQWPSHAWAMSVGHRPGDDDPQFWNGHLVTILKRPGHPRMLSDISADQFDRPSKNIHVPGPVGATINGPWTPEDPMFRILQDQNTIIEYRPFAPNDPVGLGWKGAGAMTKSPEVFEVMTREVLRRLATQEV